VGLIAAAALLVAACSAAATSPPPTAPPTPTPPSVATPSASAPSASGGSESLTINVADKSGIGAYLTDQRGFTLYWLTGDTMTSPTCTAGCIANWFPLVVSGGQRPVAGPGVTGALTTFTRPEGTQVAYKGRPLYLFIEDNAPGDTIGQGKVGFRVATP
jgi:predicted lipoprotein with Yx(FWY)xxD motif